MRQHILNNTCGLTAAARSCNQAANKDNGLKAHKSLTNYIQNLARPHGTAASLSQSCSPHTAHMRRDCRILSCTKLLRQDIPKLVSKAAASKMPKAGAIHQVHFRPGKASQANPAANSPLCHDCQVSDITEQGSATSAPQLWLQQGSAAVCCCLVCCMMDCVLRPRTHSFLALPKKALTAKRCCHHPEHLRLTGQR